MSSNLEVRKVGHLGLCSLVEANDLLDEGLVVALQTVTVFL